MASRLVRFVVSVYVLCAIAHTTYAFFLAPAVRSVVFTGSDIERRSNGTASEAASLSAARAQSTQPRSKAHQDKLLLSGPRKHPALENAGVRAADIRQEDAGDRVWAAAEAAEASSKKGKKKSNKFVPYTPPASLQDSKALVDLRLNGIAGAEWHRDQIYWHPPSHVKAHSSPVEPGLVPTQHSTPVPMSEDQFLSMTFGSALQPSKVIPYFYRATGPDEPGFNREDITIATLVTGNRFKVFERLVEKYQGARSMLLGATSCG